MFRFLIVDDNPAEAELLRVLLRRLGRPHEVYHVINGMDALDFLHCRTPYADAPRPNIILLDINMPKMNGFDVLASIKSDPELSVIPVLMLSTSILAADIGRAYQLHANCYLQKPTTLQRAEQITKAIEAFWIDVAVLPSCEEKMSGHPASVPK